MKFRIRSVAAAVMATGAVLAMSVGSASAAPVFTINPNAIPGNATVLAPFLGTNFSGTSSELLHLTTTTGNIGSGWAQITAVSNGATVVPSFTSGILQDYQLYLTYSLAATLTGGTNGAAGSTYELSALNFSVWADPGYNGPSSSPNETTFNLANAASNTEATVGGVTTDDILLGVGSLIVGDAKITDTGGAGLTAINYFAVCDGVNTANVGGVPVSGGVAGCTTTGASFFSLPIPFYQLAFSGFINAANAITLNNQGTVSTLDDVVAVQDAVAVITFNNVPEPGSIALLGIALAGLGVSVRRSKKTLL